MFDLKSNFPKSATNFGTVVTMIVFLAACAGKPVEPTITAINSPDALAVEDNTPFPENDSQPLPEEVAAPAKVKKAKSSHGKKSSFAGHKHGKGKGKGKGGSIARIKSKSKGKSSKVSSITHEKSKVALMGAGTVGSPTPSAPEMGIPPADLAHLVVPAPQAEVGVPASTGLNFNYFFIIPVVLGFGWMVQRVRKHRLSRRLVFNG